MKYAQLYQQTLFDNVVPFWEEYSINSDHGGYYSCLNRDGSVYDTDKFQWLQLRQIWTFAMLYNEENKNDRWLEIAEHGARFQLQHGRDKHQDWYFSLNQKGDPLTAPYNIFTDAFASMAFAQLYKATAKGKYRDVAVLSFDRIVNRQHNPKGIYEKKYMQTRSLQNFALPMILCNLSLELEDILDNDIVNSTLQNCVKKVMHDFYDGATGLVLENVFSDGALSDSFEGRLINPGHAIEAMWFVMDVGHRLGNNSLIEDAKNRLLHMVSYGWDKKHGGIFYFKDRLSYPPQQLEWDQKLWWVHLEALEGLLKAYQYTKDEHCWNWFLKVHEYTWAHFPDSQNSEWFGYLSRSGDPLLELKGGKWKGCFHLPRALYHSYKILSDLDR
jgi:N-acylglucosamine 2-epimerase